MPAGIRLLIIKFAAPLAFGLVLLTHEEDETKSEEDESLTIYRGFSPYQ